LRVKQGKSAFGAPLLFDLNLQTCRPGTSE
jgi:hypothetical protein